MVSVDETNTEELEKNNLLKCNFSDRTHLCHNGGRCGERLTTLAAVAPPPHLYTRASVKRSLHVHFEVGKHGA